MPVHGVVGICINQKLVEIAVNSSIPNQTHAMQRSFLFTVCYWTLRNILRSLLYIGAFMQNIP